jgi:predicted enzyme related to lactoylglutathione lyase
MDRLRARPGRHGHREDRRVGGRHRPRPVDEVGTEGSLAQLTDPSGAEFALWQPGTTIGVERACEEDSLMWVELNTREPEVAKRFYGEVFGWKTKAFDASDGSYDMWTLNPEQEMAEFGGVMRSVEGFPIQDECWVPYFMVADCDATVERAVAAGGQVVMPPSDAPPGRLASLTDPFGARFNLIKPAPMA